VRAASLPAQEAIAPAFMADAHGPSAAEIGSATHRLLAALDFGRHDNAAAVETLLAELVQRGVVDARAAQSVNCQAMAAMVSENNLSLDLSRLRLYPELPVALLLPASDAQLLAELGLHAAPEQLAPGDAVYVQGTLDLLAVRDESAGAGAGEWDALVLDYKTDRNVSAAELAARYRRQLSWYCRAVALMLPGKRVAWALYGLGGAGLVGPYSHTAPTD
jgi:ATP-dependent exoDNAse (exonuclease V) beta subunit